VLNVQPLSSKTSCLSTYGSHKTSLKVKFLSLLPWTAATLGDSMTTTQNQSALTGAVYLSDAGILVEYQESKWRRLWLSKN